MTPHPKESWEERFDTYIVKFLQTETAEAVIKDFIQKEKDKSFNEGGVRGVKRGFETGYEFGVKETCERVRNNFVLFEDVKAGVDEIERELISGPLSIPPRSK